MRTDLYVFKMNNDPKGALINSDCTSKVYAKGFLFLKPEKQTQPIPSPGTFVLAFMGAGMVIWMRRLGRL